MTKSPFQVSYEDLIKSTESRIAWMEKVYPGMITTGKMTTWTAHHNMEIEKVKLKLFKKFKKDPQTDLFKEFEKIRN